MNCGGERGERMESDEEEVVDIAEEFSLTPQLSGREQQVLAGLLAGRDGEGSVVSAEYLREKEESVSVGVNGDAGHVMRAPLEIAGITAQRLASVLADGLAARKRTLVMTKTGKKVKTQPDHAVRLKYAELAHKLRGDYPTAAAAGSANLTYEQRLKVVMQRRLT